MFGMTVMVQGSVSIELGDYANAHRYLDESLALARGANDPLRSAFSFYFLGNLAYCQHAYGEAQSHYEQSVRLLRQLNATRDLAGPLQNLGHASLRLGEINRAQLLFQESMAIHQAEQNRPGMVECLLGFAALAILHNAPAAGMRLLACAEAIGWRRAKSSWAVARKIFDHYVALAQRSLPEALLQSEVKAGKALTLPEATGYALNLLITGNAAPVPTEQARENTREKTQEITSEQLDHLSEREREVVLLICEGKSNSEIAEQLVLSKRTVEKHIANIFAKLGLTQRTQIMRWAMEHGLTAKPE